MISILVNMKKFSRFLSTVIDNIISIKTIKEIMKNIIVFFIINIFFLFTIFFICRTADNLILQDKFQSFSLKFQTEKNISYP